MNSKKFFWALTKEKDFRPEHACACTVISAMALIKDCKIIRTMRGKVFIPLLLACYAFS